MLPAAKSIPKEMLPVLDRPAIQYVVEEAAAAGIGEALLITSRHKRAIEDHFDRDGELETRLADSGRENLLASIHELTKKIRIHSTRQAEQRGLGDAVNHARGFCGDDPFVCLLGDALFSGEPPCVQLAAAFAELQTPLIGLEEVPLEKVHRYGIVGGTMIRPGLIRIESLVEKPAPTAAPSRLAIAARYVFTPAIFDCIDQTPPGAGGEIQLTDAMKLLLKRTPIHGVVLSAKRHDIGDPADWLIANVQLAAANPALWKRLEPILRGLIR